MTQQPTSAWTSSVWGSKTGHTERRALKPGEEACAICLENAVEVKFRPCAHELCLQCVNQLRASNIFKVRRCRSCARHQWP